MDAGKKSENKMSSAGNTPEQSQLGKASAYVDQYDPSLLFPIPPPSNVKRSASQVSPHFLVPTFGLPTN